MSARYRVELLPTARRQLEKFETAIQHRLTTVMQRLGSDPRPAGVKQLRGPGGILRLRSGDYRVLYQVFDDRLIVLVIRLGHRREVYRAAALKRLRRPRR